MGIRYEAWTLPWDAGGFKRKIAHLPVTVGSGTGDKRFSSTGGDGQAQVALANFARIEEVISPTVGSLIRAYDGATLLHDWMCTRVPKSLTDASRFANLSGPSLEAAFDGALIYAREYPDTISPVQDTIWAGDNVLSDGGMEQGETVNEKYELWRSATGGTFTLTVMGQTTASINWNQDAATLETRLQDLSNVDDVVVTVGDGSPGSSTNPWQIEFIVPAVVAPAEMTWTDSLTGGSGELFLKVLQHGTDDVPAHWTKSQYADRKSTPDLHGSYAASAGFKRDTAHVRTGTYSIRVDGLTRYAGLQQVVNVEPGLTYQASIWAYTTDATEVFKFIARSIYLDGVVDGLAQDGGSIPANTWTEFTFEVHIPNNVDQIIFRFAAVGKANPAPFWVDDAVLLEGMAAATPGTIATVLLDDATLDHVADPRGPMLEWVAYDTFTDLLDSNGNAWSSAISFTAQYGESYGQVWDKLVNLGFEWGLVAKAVPVGIKTHDFKLYNKGGRDSAPSTAITIGQGVTSGDIAHRIPDFTALLVEGTATYYEAESAAAANFGRIEKFIAARDTPDNATLQLLADEAFDAEAANRTAAHFNVVETPHHARPGINYLPGDTIPMQAPPALEREYRRVVAFDYANTVPATYSVTGSTLLGGEAAAFELVRRLWRRFKRPDVPRRSGSANPTGGAAGEMTVAIAAGDASEFSKNRADVVCIGTDDDLVVQEWINKTRPNGAIHLSDGTFIASGKVRVYDFQTLTAEGHGTHWFADVPDDWAIEGIVNPLGEGNDGDPTIEGFDVTNVSGHGVRLVSESEMDT